MMIGKGLSLLVALCFSLLSILARADYTPTGKITLTQGHFIAKCRIVQFKENATGTLRHFRIPDNGGTQDNGIAAVALSALIANRDVTIVYDPAQTTGCGSEPAIQYISIN